MEIQLKNRKNIGGLNALTSPKKKKDKGGKGKDGTKDKVGNCGKSHICYACGRPGHVAHQCAFDAGWYSKFSWCKKGNGYGKDRQGNNALKQCKCGRGCKKGKRKGMSKEVKVKSANEVIG